MAEYSSFFAAVEDILAYVRETKQHIEIDDEPMKLRIGFRSMENPEACWHVRLRDLRSTSLPDETENAVLRKYLMLVSGRRLLAEGFSEGRCIWQHAEDSPP